jgi:RNA polymerase sigma factor (sigma-70 family)
MADQSQEFAGLMRRVCAGSQGAAEELIERYGAHILRIVRRKLHRSLRAKFDSADFVQAVWASFFALPLERYQFEQSQALVGFLFHLARNKVVEAVRQRLQTQKYNINRERALDDDQTRPANTMVVREPSPSEIAIAREEWDRLLAGQPEHYRQILVALRDGETQQAVAEQLGLNERTVRRMLRKIGEPDETR